MSQEEKRPLGMFARLYNFIQSWIWFSSLEMRGIKGEKICSTPWRWDFFSLSSTTMRWLLFQVRTSGWLCVNQERACTWCGSLDPWIRSGQDHCTRRHGSFAPTRKLREQAGAKIPISSLHFAKPCTQGGGGGVGCGYTLRKKSLFLIFSGVILSLEFFLLVLWRSRVTSIEQSCLFSRFYIICWSNSRPAHCRTLSLMLAQRDLWRVWCLHTMEKRTRLGLRIGGESSSCHVLPVWQWEVAS